MERMERILLVLLVLSECLILSTCLQPQYHIINKDLSWFEAQTYCRQTYTDLVTIQNDEEEIQLLEKLLISGFHNAGNYWIGLYTKIVWEWSDEYKGNRFDYKSWAFSEPNFGEEQYCVGMSKLNDWHDLLCHVLLPFICHTAADVSPGFVFVNEPMNWTRAQTYCRVNHGDLATVKNDDENKKVWDLVPNETIAWIGLFRDPGLYWSDGSNFNYNKIKGPNPIGSLKVMCGFIALESSSEWKFVSCENKFPFVCFGPRRTVKTQVMKLRLKTEDSAILNNPAVKEDLLKKLQDRLKKNGVTGVSLKWREQPDGRVFHKEKKTEKTEL